MLETPAPIALFVYARPEHTRRTLEALLENPEAEDTELFVFSDGAGTEDEKKDVQAVRSVIQSVQGFKSITTQERPRNYGLANNIEDGVTQVVESAGRVIVVEDDVYTSPYFLKFMNDGLRCYAECPKVAAIHAYTFDVQQSLPETFFLTGSDVWGWATWKRAWATNERDGTKLLDEMDKKHIRHKIVKEKGVDLYGMLQQKVAGKNQGWDIQWSVSCYLKHMITLYPGISLSKNIGMDGSGTHCKENQDYEVNLSSKPIEVKPIELKQDAKVAKLFADYLRPILCPPPPSLLTRIKQKVYRVGSFLR